MGFPSKPFISFEALRMLCVRAKLIPKSLKSSCHHFISFVCDIIMLLNFVIGSLSEKVEGCSDCKVGFLFWLHNPERTSPFVLICTFLLGLFELVILASKIMSLQFSGTLLIFKPCANPTSCCNVTLNRSPA